MNSRMTIAVMGVIALVGGWSWHVRDSAIEREHARAYAIAAVAAESEQRSGDIEFFEGRAARDPQSAIDRAKLAALYLQRARAENDYQDYVRAESVALASLSLRTARNQDVYAVLVSALLAQHRFTDAHAAAAQLVHAQPEVASYRALLGETCLELGDYACARASFDAVAAGTRSSLAVLPQLARWAETRGDTAGARKTFTQALTAARSAPHLPREQAAWFQLRAADLNLRQGRVAHAERALRDGLAINPDDYRLLAATARLAAVQHDWKRAIEYGDRSIAISLDPATLGVVSDAYAALGDTAKAAEYFIAMEASVGQQPGAFHRAWSLFLLDHGRRIPEVLAAAQSEIAARPDIHGYDLLAWALHKSGRNADARVAIAHALAQGTQDAMLLYHAGVIEASTGNNAVARDHLQRALAIAPMFDHTAPGIARALLDSLRNPTRTVAVGRR